MKIKQIMIAIIIFIVLLVIFTLITVCANNKKTTNLINSTPEATDYSQATHWLSLPATVKPVDVFYLYPTAWTKTANDQNVCEIDNPSMLIGAPAAFARQATAFETVGNIYAPYYRQVAVSVLDLSSTEREKLIKDTPTLDATAAFDYYIKHYNNGRPFILVGHSQGSDVLSNLLSGYMKDNPEVYKNMIAAYAIGFPITQAYLDDNPYLKFATGPDDTGVIISYNTEASDVVAATNPVLSGAVGLVINPITWTRDETLATKNESLGSFMPTPVVPATIPPTYTFSQVPQYADAKIDKTNGVLISSTADEDALFKLNAGFGRGIYHSFDIPFYYYNLRENAANRTAKFLNK